MAGSSTCTCEGKQAQTEVAASKTLTIASTGHELALH
jgi:hypothetical protein